MTRAAAPFPWDEVIRALVLRAGLAPDAAWRLSLVEARLILGRAGPAPPGRGDLARLMALYPDSMIEG